MDAQPLTADERRRRVFDFLDARGIRYEWYEHPEAPTCEIALQYCRGDGARHCKNLFFRNHKGDRHYLVCFDAEQRLAIRDLEQRLHQGKLSFASPDIRMRDWPRYAFHPNDNRATVLIEHDEFMRYLTAVGNSYEFIELY